VLATIEAGIASDGKSFTFHELRHTAAAFMIDEGGDPLQVMRRMGHSDIRTTYSLYGHLFPDREDELVSKLDRRYLRALEVFEKRAEQPEPEGRFRISLGQPVRRGTDLPIHGREEPSDQGKRFVGPDGFEPSASPLSGVSERI
jgi:hypothetical protein